VRGRTQEGFSLIELLVTLAVLAVLAAAAWPIAELERTRADEKELREALREIRKAIDAYKQAGDDGRIVRRSGEAGYPPSLDVLVSGVEDAKDPQKRKMYFMRKIPRDPFADNPDARPERMWGLRSYASPPEKPAPGADVFDVYSQSVRTGLNGVAYREW